MLDQDPSSDLFLEDPNSSICISLLTNKQTNGQINNHENNTLVNMASADQVFIKECRRLVITPYR